MFRLYYDYLIENGVKEEQIISIALDDDTYVKYRNPEELSKYIRSQIVNNEMYYILIDEVQYTIQTVKGIKVSGNTIANYLNYLSESFLFSNAKRYDVKGKKYFEYPSKYYCTDIGLRNARLNFRQLEETHIMENIIYNELLCRECSVDVGVVEIVDAIEGTKRKKQCEIDFVVNKGPKKYYIQSALNVSDASKMEIELRPLKSTKDFLKKIIIVKTMMKSWIDEYGIVHLGLYEFLLNKDSLEI